MRNYWILALMFAVIQNIGYSANYRVFSESELLQVDSPFVAPSSYPQANGAGKYLTKPGQDITKTNFSNPPDIGAYSTDIVSENSLNFSNDLVNLGTSNTFNFSTSSKFAIDFWLYPQGSAGWYGLVSREIWNNNQGWLVYAHNNELNFGAPPNSSISTTGGLQVNTWQHVVVNYDAGSVAIYVDGVLKGSGASSINSLSGQTLLLGARHENSNSGFADFLPGSLDELRIWDFALCENQIQQLKDHKISGTESGLLAYYDFNTGVPNGNNSSNTTLFDLAGNNDGTLSNSFSLSGSTSNWTNGVTLSSNSISLDSIPDYSGLVINVYLDSTGVDTISSINYVNTSGNGCGNLSYILADTTFACSDIGTNTTSLIVTNSANKSDTFSVSLNVLDTIKPAFVANDISVYLDNNFQRNLTIDELISANVAIQGASVSFDSLVFTNAGATGRFGPTQTQVNSAYSGTHLAGQVTINTQGYQEWTVPATGKYFIKTIGAGGGQHNPSAGFAGKGALMSGEFELTKGDVLKIVVGQKGETTGGQYGQAAGGGGGTFISYVNNTPILVAGGGNGDSWDNFNTNGPSALLTNSGTAGGSNTGGRGGGGGGFSGDGDDYNNFQMGGHSFLNGALGGVKDQVYGPTGSGDGGFGGGGGSRHEGGGGGGYHGGKVVNINAYNSSYPSYGAGSYNIGLNQNNLANVNTEHGEVIIKPLFTTSVENCDSIAYTLNPSRIDCNTSLDTSTTVLGNALAFDGTNDYITRTITNLGITGHTIQAWIKTTSTKSSTGYAGNSAMNIVGENTGSVGMSFGVTNGKIDYHHYNGTWNSVLGNTDVNDGIWHHVAVSHASNGTVTLYLDGVEDGTGSFSISGSSTYTSINQIGAGYPTQDYFNGSIDEVAFFNTAKSSAEISGFYDNGISGNENNLQGYYDFNEGSGSNSADNSTNSNLGTLNNFNTSTAWVTGAGQTKVGKYVAISGTDETGNTTIDTAFVQVIDTVAPQIANLIDTIYISGSGDTIKPSDLTINDNCSNYNITLSDSVYDCNGLLPESCQGNAIDMDGTDDIVTIPNSTSLNTPVTTGELTIESWVYLDQYSSDSRTIVMKGSYGYGLAVEVGGGDNGKLGYWDQGGWTSATRSDGIVPTGTWTHVAATVKDNGSNLTVTYYINGVNAGTKTSSQSAISSGSNGALIIGSQGTSCYCNDWIGDLDELRIWNVVRTPNEISENYQSCLNGNESGLIAYYKFNETSGTTVSDETSNNNNGVLSNQASFVSSGANLNGPSNNKIEVSVTDPFGNSVTDSLTLVFLDTIYPSFTTNNVTVYLDVNGSASINASILYSNLLDNCSNPSVIISDSIFDCTDAVNSPVSIAITAADGYNNVFVDSANVTVLDTINPTITGISDTAIYLDASGNASIALNDLNLSATDNCGNTTLTISDSTFNCNDVSMNSTSTGIEFDGIDDYINILSSSSLNGGSALSFEAWIYPNANITSTQSIASKWEDDGDQRGWLFRIGAFGTNIISLHATPTGVWSSSTRLALNTGVTVTPNQWNHIAFTFIENGSNNVKVYLNGAQVAQTTWNRQIDPGNTANLILGGYDGAGNGVNAGADRHFFDGKMDDVRIWNSEKTPTEIASNYTSALTGNETSLAAYYNFESGSGSALTDLSSNNNNGTLTNMNTASAWVSGTTALSTSSSNYVTITAIDASGNATTDSINVTVLDTIPADLTTQSPTVYLDSNGLATITIQDVVTDTTEACGVSEITLSRDTFNCVDIITGGATTANALDFDGINDVVSTSININPTNIPSITIEAWVNTNTISGNRYVFESDNGGWDRGLLIRGGTYHIFAGQDLGTTVVPTIGAWEHVAVSYSSTDVKFYLNGVLQYSKGSGDLTGNLSDNLTIGGNVFWWDGKIANFRVWNTERTATEILNNMNNPLSGNESGLLAYYKMDDGSGNSLTDYSPNNNNATLSNMDNSDWVTGPTLGSISVNASTIITSTDNSGNISYDTVAVSVYDTISPTAITKDLTLTLNFEGKASIIASDIDSNSFDNCSIDSLWLSDSLFTVSNVGQNTIWLYAQDESGNTDSAAAIITIIDQGEPYAGLGKALDIASSNQKVSISTDSITLSSTAFTQEFWVRNDALNGFQWPVTTGKNWAHVEANGNMRYRMTTSNGQFNSSSNQPMGFVQGKWAHVASTYDGSDVKLYLNGEFKWSYPVTGTLNFSGDSINVGYYETYPFDGAVDEVRIWNVARTESEIKENYNKRLSGNETNLAAYFNFDDPDNAALFDVVGQRQLGVFRNGISTSDYIDSKDSLIWEVTELSNVGNTIAYGSAWDKNPSDVLSFSEVLDADNKFEIDSISGEVRLTSRLDFEISTNHLFTYEVQDLSGNRDTASLNIQVIDEQDAVFAGLGNSLSLDAVDDYAAIAHDSSFTATSITIEAWVYWEGTGNQTHFITGKGFEQYEIHTGNTAGNNTIRFIPVPDVYLDAPVGSFMPNRWNHIAAVYDPGNNFGEIYINAQPVNATSTGTNPLTTSLNANTDDIFIGQRSNGSFKFNGDIDEVRFWNSALTQQEIESNYRKRVSPNANGLLVYVNFDNSGDSLLRDLVTSNPVNLFGGLATTNANDTLKFTINENSLLGDTVASAMGWDSDSSAISFTGIGGNLSDFNIDFNSGFITASPTTQLDFETDSVHYFTYEVTEAGDNEKDTATVLIKLNNLNEAPVLSQVNNQIVCGNIGSDLISLTVTDEDPWDGDEEIVTVVQVSDSSLITNLAIGIGDGSSDREISFDVDSTLSGLVTFMVTANDSAGLSDTSIFTYQVNPRYYSYDSLGICKGDSINIYGTWYNDEATDISVFTTVDGCDSTIQTYIRQDSLLDRLVTTPIQICENDTGFVTVTASENAVMYKIYDLTNNQYLDSLVGDGNDILIPITLTDTVTVEVRGSGICDWTMPGTYTINHIPLLSPSISTNGPTIFCSYDSVTFTSNYTTGNIWSTGDTSQSITVSAEGTYSLTVGTASGCPITVEDSIIHYPLPLDKSPAVSTINNGLMAYYPLDGDVLDYSTNNRNGNPIGAQNFATDRNGNSNASFIGTTSSYVDLQDDFLTNETSVSIAGWLFRTSGGSTVEGLFGQDDQIELYLFTSSGALNIWNGTPIATGYNVPLNTWTHIAYIGDGSGQKVYVNGTQVYNTSTPLNPNPNASSFKNASIGRAANNGGFPGTGYFDEVRFYNRAISEDEIDYLADQSQSINITAPAEVCFGDTATLTLSTTEFGVDYYLHFNQGSNSISGPYSGTGGPLSIEYGPMTVDTTFQIFAQNATCEIFLTDKPSIAVNPLPIITTHNDTNMGPNDTIQIWASGGATYAWSDGQTGDTISITPDTNTQYFVTVTSAKGCQETDSLYILLNSYPVVNDTVFTVDENTQFSVIANLNAFDPDSSDTLSYQLIGGDTNIYRVSQSGNIYVDNAFLNVEIDFVDTIRVRVTDSGDPALTDSAQVVIFINDINEKPILSADTFLIDENSYDSLSTNAFVYYPSASGIAGAGACGGTLRATSSSVETFTWTDQLSSSLGINSITVQINSRSAINSTQYTYTLNGDSIGQINASSTGGCGSQIISFTLDLDKYNFGGLNTFTWDIPANAAGYKINGSWNNGISRVVVNGNTPIGQAIANDVDTSKIFSYSIISGADSVFAINANNGAFYIIDSSYLDVETQPTFELTVEVADGGLVADLYDTATYIINLNDLNEKPILAADTFLIDENSVNGLIAGIAVASDVDTLTTFTYTVIGGADSVFTIDGSSGSISVIDSSYLDVETQPVFEIIVEVVDGGLVADLYDTATYIINLNDLNEKPIITDYTTAIDENSAQGLLLTTVSATDQDTLQDFRYFTISGDTTAIGIDSLSGAVTIIDSAQFNRESITVLAVDVVVFDGGLPPEMMDTASIIINIEDVNERPTLVLDTFNVNENSIFLTPLGLITATDVDTVTNFNYYTLGGADSIFGIDQFTGEVYVSNPIIDFESINTYDLVVEVHDGGIDSNLFDTLSYRINVIDINEKPQLIADTFNVDENEFDSTLIGVVSTFDFDVTQDFTYSLIGGADSVFSIVDSSGEILVVDSVNLDHENYASLQLEVRVADGGLIPEMFDTLTYTIFVNDINEKPILAADTFLIDENSVNGLVSGISVASDVDTTTTFNYSIIGGADGVFAIDSTSGSISVIDSSYLDVETQPVFEITVEVADGGLVADLYDTATYVINLNDINEKPILSSKSLQIVENALVGTIVDSIFATDQDTLQSFTYNLIGGADTAFSINPSNGNISVLNTAYLNYEEVVTMFVNVEVADGGLTPELFDTLTYQITVIDTNEKPTIFDSIFVQKENSTLGFNFGKLVEFDEDSNTVFNYSFVGGADTVFSIDGSGNIALSDSAAFNFETTTQFSLSVQIGDGGTPQKFDTASVLINVEDFNEKPGIAAYTFFIDENSPNGIIAGTVTSFDVDANTNFRYTAIGGDVSVFGVDSISGQVRVLDQTMLDYETDSTFLLEIEVGDRGQLVTQSAGISPELFDTTTISLRLIDINEAPVISILSDDTICALETTAQLPIQIFDFDAKDGANTLSLQAFSLDTNLVSTDSIQFTGTDSARFIQITPTIPNFGMVDIGVVVFDTMGTSDTSIFTLNVQELPNTNAGLDVTICNEDVIGIAASGGTSYSWSNGFNGSSQNVNPSITTSYIVTATAANGCTREDTVVVNVNQLTNVNLPAFADICINVSPDTLNTATPIGGTYLGLGVFNGVFNPSVAGLGTNDITYTYTDSNGCTAIDTAALTVLNAPNVQLSGFGFICTGDSAITLNQGLPSGGTYTGSGVSNNIFIPTSVTPGIYNIKYEVTNSQGCPAEITKAITVFKTDTASLTTNLPELCENGSNANLAFAVPAGGVYNGNPFIDSIGVFNPLAAGIGTYPLEYIYSNSNGCVYTLIDSITVNAKPIVTLGTVPSVCNNDSVQLLSSGLPIGGTYSGVGVSGNQFNPISSGPGLFDISYSFIDTNNCFSADTQQVEVFGIPSVSIQNISGVCENIDTLSLLSNGFPQGGYYLGSSIVDSTNYLPALTGTVLDTLNYVYTDSNSCSNIASKVVVIYPKDSVALNPYASICENDNRLRLKGGFPTGGLFGGLGVDSLGFFNPSQVGSGNFQISYTFTNVNGCVETVNQPLEVKPIPAVTLGAIPPLCESSDPDTLSFGFPSGGNYSGAGVINNIFYPAIPGVGVDSIYYSYTDSVTGCTNSDTSSIQVFNAPNAVASNEKSICFGESVNLFATGGVSYLWSDNTVGPNNTVSPTSTTLYTVTVTNNIGCRDEENVKVTVYSQMSLSFSKFDANCNQPNGIATVIVNGGTGPFGFNWTTGSTSSLANNLSSGVYGVTVSDKYGCKQTDIVTLSDKGAPNVSLINSVNPTCYTANDGSLEIAITKAKANYDVVWSNGDTGTFINNLLGGSYDVAVEDENKCKTFETFTLTAPDSISVDETLIEPTCGLTNGAIYTNISGGTTPYNITWTPGTSTADSIVGVGAGVYAINISDDNNCNYSKSIALNNFNTLSVEVDSLVYPSCGSNDGYARVITNPSSINVTYNWSNSATTSGIANLVSGIYDVTVTDTLTGCISVLSVNLPNEGVPQPELCLVSVDSSLEKAVLTWDENAIAGVQSYTVLVKTNPNKPYIEYKDVPVSSGGVLVDSIIDVSQHPVSYAIRANGTCGVSNPSNPQNNMVLIYAKNQLGVSLFWTPFGETAEMYYVHRFTPTSGWIVIDSVNTDTTAYVDPNLPSPIPDKFFYAIEAKVDNNCTNDRAFSNLTENLGDVGIEVEEYVVTDFGTVEMYPNPTLGELNINFDLIKNEEVELRIYTMQGQLVETEFLGEMEQSSQYHMDLGHLDSGPYFVEIKTEDFVQKLPLIIQ